jgi:hypothetical protein
VAAALPPTRRLGMLSFAYLIRMNAFVNASPSRVAMKSARNPASAPRPSSGVHPARLAHPRRRKALCCSLLAGSCPSRISAPAGM